MSEVRCQMSEGGTSKFQRRREQTSNSESVRERALNAERPTPNVECQMSDFRLQMSAGGTRCPARNALHSDAGGPQRVGMGPSHRLWDKPIHLDVDAS
jgi:hypothetical protein